MPYIVAASPINCKIGEIQDVIRFTDGKISECRGKIVDVATFEEYVENLKECGIDTSDVGKIKYYKFWKVLID